MPSFVNIPDDVLTGILRFLPALSILSCRQVCRKLNQLTKGPHVWINLFSRTQYMLRPAIDPTKPPLSELEAIIVRAEKLHHKWADETGLRTSPRTCRLKHSDPWWRPVAIMGEYLIFLKDHGRGRHSYQWIPKQISGGEVNILFEYRLPERVVWHERQMNHELGTFYLTCHYSDDEKNVELIEFTVDDASRRPRLSYRSPAAINPQMRDLTATYIRGNFVTFCWRNFDSVIECDWTILDLRTRALAQFRLVPPTEWDHISISPGIFMRMVYVSDTHILLIVNGTHFCVFPRPNGAENKLSQTTLQATFSGEFPEPLHRNFQVFPRTYPSGVPSFIIVGVRIGSPEDSPTRINLVTLDKSGDVWSFKTESLAVPGAWGAYAFPAPSSKADYILGVLSARNTAVIGNLRYYALRIGIPNTESDEGFGPLTARLMEWEPADKEEDVILAPVSQEKDRSAFVDGREECETPDPPLYRQADIHVIDFDPFLGTVFLASPTAPEWVLGFQSIVVLDYL